MKKIFKQIEKRNAALQANEYFMDKATFELLSNKFEEPKPEENLIICTCENDFNKVIKRIVNEN